jgi:hypothetical protein
MLSTELESLLGRVALRGERWREGSSGESRESREWPDVSRESREQCLSILSWRRWREVRVVSPAAGERLRAGGRAGVSGGQEVGRGRNGEKYFIDY